MAISLASFNIEKWKNYADWKLLVLLLLFLNVKLAIKIPAIALIYLLQFDFKFGFTFKNSRLPLFYPLIIGLAFAGFIINQGYQNYQLHSCFFNGYILLAVVHFGYPPGKTIGGEANCRSSAPHATWCFL
jgi:hypothetical protein